MKKNIITYLFISLLSIFWTGQLLAEESEKQPTKTVSEQNEEQIDPNTLVEENAPMSRCGETLDVKEMNDCAKKVYKEAEKQLQAIISEIEDSLEYAEKRLFKKAHRQWNVFYKNYCEFATYTLKEEVGFPFHQYDCFDRATRHYIQSLEIFLENLDV